MLAATQQKITEGGAITSAESNMSKQRLELQVKSGLMEAKRRASLGTDSATTTPSANASAPSMNAADAQKSRMDFYAKRNGTPEPMLQRPPMGSVSGNPNAAVPTTNADGMVSVPPSSVTSAPVAARRESRIDGMPASLAIARSQAIMAAGGPREEFGAAAANKNLGEEVTNDSLRSAMADYKRRSAADDPIARAGRGAAYTAATSAPGNLKPGPVSPPAPGPLQAALIQSRADIKTREASEADRFRTDFVDETNSVVALNTSPMKALPGSKLYGQRDDSGLPTVSPSTPASSSRESAASAPTSRTPEPSLLSARFEGNNPPLAPREDRADEAKKKYLKNRKTSDPTWMRGTGLGNTLEFLSNPVL